MEILYKVVGVIVVWALIIFTLCVALSCLVVGAKTILTAGL